ncbi:NAD(P)-binding protein [Thelephora terrestris]|uniref:NAD(P)-binding protein n=1 Tax=Thelephora terrestris TaxID=56493 RepID=A0A9P6H3H1_9AGAM|nr:NAD(P)-binding protein [Thelephora terrestris]
MTTILDDQLYSHSDRLAGKVVLITGGGAGIGRETALQCAKFRAKLVLGDINESTAQSVAAQIKDDGGEAIGLRCDVTSWEDQLNLFQTAFDAFGPADVVVANAGINETGDYTTPKVKDGKLEKPTMTTIDVNLMGTAYTTHLATHFLQLDRKQDNVLKSIVVLGSMASWKPAATGPMYSATKCGVLGMTRSLAYPLEQKNIRVAVVHPFFTDTALLDTTNRVLAAGLAFVPIERVGGTIILAATDRDMSTTGAAWVLPDGGPLLRLESEAIKGGVYDILTNRAMQFEA